MNQYYRFYGALTAQKAFGLPILLCQLTFLGATSVGFAEDNQSSNTSKVAAFFGVKGQKPLDLKTVTGETANAKIQVNSTQIKGNGTGYSGPDLAPVAIPGTLDHGVEASAALNAITTCYGDGIAVDSHLLMPLFKDLYQVVDQKDPGIQVYHQSFCDTCSDKAYSDEKIQAESVYLRSVILKSSSPEINKWANYQFELYISNSFKSDYGPKEDQVNMTGNDPEKPNRQFKLHAIGILPYLTFSKQVKDFTYTKLGTKIDGKWYLKNLRVVSPKNRILQFMTEKNEPVNMAIDTQQFTDCLNSALSYGQ